MIARPCCRSLPALTVAAALLVAAAGCGGARGGRMAFRPLGGSLRENLSRLEFQNRALKEELADARDEADRLSGDLEHAEIDRRELAARLDRYQAQLGRNDPPASADNYGAVARPDTDDPSGSFAPTRPAAQPQRRAPFTQIPNRTGSGPVIDLGTPANGDPGSESVPRSYEDIPRPYMETPPVRYFDLSPSAGRTRLDDRPPLADREPLAAWSPRVRGSSNWATYR